MLTVLSWNMNQRAGAWQHLRSLVSQFEVSIALLQEARRPTHLPDSWSAYPPTDDALRWQVAVPRFYVARDGSKKKTKRYWASAVVATGDRHMTPREPVELHEVVDGGFASSHPGQFAVADVGLNDGTRLTVISLYGIWDPIPRSREKYVEATLHRAMSDLSVVLQDPAADLVLIAGDMNLYSYTEGDTMGDRSMTVWSRLSAYGFEICGPFRTDTEPTLERCPCPDQACRHVNTYLHKSRATSQPHQLDFILATRQLRDRITACWADPDSAWTDHSDHRPIFASFDL